MGCAACFGDKKIQEPRKAIKPLKIVFLQQTLKYLKPSQLIHEKEFLELVTGMYEFCAKSGIIQIIAQQVQVNNTQSRRLTQSSDFMKSKWKLLIFCNQNVFYQQKYNSFNSQIEHSCFTQIQKDLDRTFPEQKIFASPQGIRQFKNILKRIAVYFPQLGYTQGVNFIVGYLMVLGFTDNQTFWFTINIALNEKYLLLGLFQDGFPLSSIYCKLFKYLMQKKVPKLYKNFEKIGVADQIWIFKWFMTYYIYSFPISVVKQIWDFVIVRGGIGLVYFGISLIMVLQKILTKFEDDSEIANFFSGMKDLQNFEHYVNLKQLIDLSYTMNLQNEEVSKQIKKYKLEYKIQNFYVRFYSNYDNEQLRNKILEQWHENIKMERLNFQQIQLIQQEIKFKEEKHQVDSRSRLETKNSHEEYRQNSEKSYKLHKKQITHQNKNQEFEEIIILKLESDHHFHHQKSLLKTLNKHSQSQQIKKQINGQHDQESRDINLNQQQNTQIQNLHQSHHHHYSKKKTIENSYHEQRIQIFDLDENKYSFKKKKIDQSQVLMKPIKKRLDSNLNRPNIIGLQNIQQKFPINKSQLNKNGLQHEQEDHPQISEQIYLQSAPNTKRIQQLQAQSINNSIKSKNDNNQCSIQIKSVK